MLKPRLFLPFFLVLVVLVPVYISTLQTIPNGSEDYYMIDVGETQIVLNRWGTLHATGYPLFVMLGNIAVTGLRFAGVSAATAPAVHSLFWGLVALALIYTLAVHLTGNGLTSAAMTILFGLARTVWIHNSIAEIYSFGLVFLALLLLIALWQRRIPGRIYWLALIGGFGVFHHRALVMVIPALVFAVWPELKPRIWPKSGEPVPAYILRLLRFLLVMLVLGAVGFLPYAYLYYRAGAVWVYGDPGSWSGFWDQFLGREAARFIGPPANLDGLLANFNAITNVLITDITLPGIILGLLGLILAMLSRERRRAAITLFLSGSVAYVFHILLYTDILSALILPILLSLAFGWLFLAEIVLSLQFSAAGQKIPRPIVLLFAHATYLIPTLIFAAYLFTENQTVIQEMTTDRTGVEMIAMAQETPPNSTLMIDWGPRHFAVGFARDVLNILPGVRLVDHKADFDIILTQQKLITPDFTFFNRPVSWWEDRIGAPIFINAAAPHLVEIKTFRDLASSPLPEGITPVEQSVECTPTSVNLRVAWGTSEKPDHDLSVFVHLLDANGTVIAQADESAPVYGWRPLTTWTAGEIVRDVYPLPYVAEGATIKFGLYRQLDTGEYLNEYEYTIPAVCGE